MQLPKDHSNYQDLKQESHLRAQQTLTMIKGWQAMLGTNKQSTNWLIELNHDF
jgi:hypothetical protein